MLSNCPALSNSDWAVLTSKIASDVPPRLSIEPNVATPWTVYGFDGPLPAILIVSPTAKPYLRAVPASSTTCCAPCAQPPCLSFSGVNCRPSSPTPMPIDSP